MRVGSGAENASDGRGWTNSGLNSAANGPSQPARRILAFGSDAAGNVTWGRQSPTAFGF
jgi:hypothetical protein